MKQPEGPFLELSFYCAHQPEKDVFLQLVKALVGQGAQFAEGSSAHFGEGIRDIPFSGVTEEYADSISIANMSELQQYLNDPDVRVTEVLIESGIFAGTTETVTYQRLPV